MTNNIIENDAHSSSDEDEPPPLPPPRHESLNHNCEGHPVDKPLPTIPNSTSLNEFNYVDINTEGVSSLSVFFSYSKRVYC